MALGGGGSPAPASELALQLAFAIAAAAWLFAGPPVLDNSPTIPKSLVCFGLALLAVPLIQLVPLPPAIWHDFPRRELLREVLAIVGAADEWRPLSIAPYRTFGGLLALVPAIGAMWAVALLPREDRRLLVAVVAGMALAGAGLGALQVASGPEAFRIYPASHRDWLTAFHANRNAAADVLLIGSLAATAWFAVSAGRFPMARPARLLLYVSAQTVLLAAIVFTGSRAGIALAALIMSFHFRMLSGSKGRLWKATRRGVILALVLAFPVFTYLANNTQVLRVAERFAATSDTRFALWRDGFDAMRAFWPTGSGVGTFSSAIQSFERARHLDPFFPNRAHNDYLEFIIEAGILAPAILVLGTIALSICARRAWRLSPQDHVLQLFALGSLAIIALHSLVDYPLRNMTIACLAGVAAGLLTATPRGNAVQGSPRGRNEEG